MTLTSNTESAESLAEVLRSRGITLDEPEQKPAEATETKPSEQPVKTGEDAPAPGSETAPVSDAEEKKPQEQSTKPKEDDDNHPSRGKFKAEKTRLREQIARISDDLETERGSKAALRAKLEAAEAELAKLTKPSEATPKEEALQRPKRPTRAEFEYDDDKYEAAMSAYEVQVDEFNTKMTDKRVTDALAARDKADQDKAQKAVADAFWDDFVARRDAEAAEIEDYKDLLEAVPDFEVSPDVRMRIIQSEVPAHLVHYFMKDHVENDGKELARLSRLDPLIQGREVAKIESKLMLERAQGKKPAPAAPKVAPVVTKQPADEAPIVEEKPAEPVKKTEPAKPPVRPALEAPIEPLGSRSNTRTKTLADAKTPQEFIALRNQGIQR